MARAQMARDAVMADQVRRHAGRGVVLLAGNGHVRRDLGVPRWLADIAPERVLTVGFVEEGDAQSRVPQSAQRFDAVVVAPRATRNDPCERLRTLKPHASPSRAAD
ncbi:MAG: ChaN family lipoprotein [Burkholderiaceae bacterium]